MSPARRTRRPHRTLPVSLPGSTPDSPPKAPPSSRAHAPAGRRPSPGSLKGMSPRCCAERVPSETAADAASAAATAAPTARVPALPKHGRYVEGVREQHLRRRRRPRAVAAAGNDIGAVHRTSGGRCGDAGAVHTAREPVGCSDRGCTQAKKGGTISGNEDAKRFGPYVCEVGCVPRGYWLPTTAQPQHQQRGLAAGATQAIPLTFGRAAIDQHSSTSLRLLLCMSHADALFRLFIPLPSK